LLVFQLVKIFHAWNMKTDDVLVKLDLINPPPSCNLHLLSAPTREDLTEREGSIWLTYSLRVLVFVIRINKF